MQPGANSEACTNERVILQRRPLIQLVCDAGELKLKESHGGASAFHCKDDVNKNGTCAADVGHCLQMTEDGARMDFECPGTCGKCSSLPSVLVDYQYIFIGSCEGCRCQDNLRWHRYCRSLTQYCEDKG